MLILWVRSGSVSQGCPSEAVSGDLGRQATALHIAAEKGFKEIVQALLDSGADVNLVGKIRFCIPRMPILKQCQGHKEQHFTSPPRMVVKVLFRESWHLV